jgi:GTPase Era involved in 16S rRNA processing
MANTCWDKAENFDMDDLEDDDEDNQAQPGKVIVAVDDESLNDFLPPDRTVEFVEPRSKASNAITTQQERQQQREYCPVFMVSALQNDGVQDIVQYLVKEAMPGDWVEMDGNTTNGTDMSPQEHATEIIREKIYRTVHQEVPYNVQQRTTRFEYVSAAAATAAGYSIPSPSHHHHLTEEDSLSTFGIPTTNTATTTNNNSEQSKILCIEQDFIVSTRSHKRLLEGKNGSILKRISDQARRDLQQVFHCYVSLTLRVKIKRTNNGSQIHQLTAEDDDEND